MNGGTLGYLVNKNLLFKADFLDHEYNQQTLLTAKYNHELNSKDYLGFTLSVDDRGRRKQFSRTYFKSLNDSAYFVTSVDLIDQKTQVLGGSCKLLL